MPIIDYDSQSDASISASSSQGSSNKHPMSDVDNSMQPTSKRVNSSQSDCILNRQHANPMDDTIHSKRIGTYLKTKILTKEKY